MEDLERERACSYERAGVVWAQISNSTLDNKVAQAGGGSSG
jgi:hypothetical protein